MALDELLDGDRRGPVRAEQRQCVGEFGVAVDPHRVLRARAGTRLEDERIADLGGEIPHLARVVGRGGRGGRDADPRRACFIDGLSWHSQVAFTDVPGMPHASRTCAAAIVCDSIVASGFVDPDLGLEVGGPRRSTGGRW